MLMPSLMRARAVGRCACAEETTIEFGRGARAHAAQHLDAGRAQTCRAGAGHARIRIVHRVHHARHAGRDQGFAAGRRAAVMVARFETHVGGRTARVVAGPGQRIGLGMRPTGATVMALRQHHAVFHQHAADARIGRGGILAERGERHGARHEMFVVVSGHARSGCERRRSPGFLAFSACNKSSCCSRRSGGSSFSSRSIS